MLWAGTSFCVFFSILFASQIALAQQAANAGSPDGKAIFEQRCAKCHGEYGQGISAVVSIAGPSLQAEHDRGRVITAVETGPKHMPSFIRTLSLPEIRAVASYVTDSIAVIPLHGGNIGEGGELFRVYCAPCHRTDVRGGALAFVGANAPDISRKSLALVAGAIRWGPGGMPAFPPSVVNDQQLASIVEYIRYVQRPASPGGIPMNWYGPVAEGFAAWLIVFVIVILTTWIEKGGKG